MTSRKPTILVAIALAVCAGLLFIFSPQGQSPRSSSTQTTTVLPDLAPAPLVLERNDYPPKISGPLRIIDALTGEELDVSVKLITSRAELSLSAGEVVDLSEQPSESTILIVPEHGYEPFECDLDDRLIKTNHGWELKIPYYAVVDFQIQGLPENFLNHNSDIQVFFDPRYIPEEVSKAKPIDPNIPSFMKELGLDNSSGPFGTDYRDMTVRGMIRAGLRSKKLAPLAIERYSAHNESNSIAISTSGKHIAGWVDEGGNSCFLEVDLLPGVRTKAVLVFSERPVMRGVLLDWDNTPVANAVVLLTTALDLNDYDLSSADRHATILCIAEGTQYHSAHQRIRTDIEGKFAVAVPEGLDYSMESHAKDGYVFWNTQDMGNLPTDGREIILHLAEPTAERVTTVTFHDSSGVKITDGGVTFAIPDDIPFFRQWPHKAPLNENGQISTMGLEPGMEVSIVLFRDGLKHGAHTPPAAIVVPVSRKIEIVVPLDAYLETTD